MKLKNMIITGSIFIIIILSFTIPTILFEIQDMVMEKEVYKRGRIEGKIDVQAEKIYLVQAIQKRGYNIEIGNPNKKELIQYAISDEYNSADTVIEKELLSLKNYNVLDGELKRSNCETNIGIIDKRYSNVNNSYIINCIELVNDDTSISIEMENKTEKILYIRFDKYRMLDLEVEELMRNYVKYLDLYIIDDWKFEDGMLKSEKAQLAISLTENKESYDLSINSINKNTDVKYLYKVLH